MALTARVSALEDLQLKREIEWAEVSEKLLRYVKRISAVEARAAEREGATHTDPVTSAVLRMKFPPKQNGG